MKPFCPYLVKSAVPAWDSRWIYVGPWFLQDVKVSQGISSAATALPYATSLTKYIIKKGRITVTPAQFLTEAGWIPRGKDNCQQDKDQGSYKSSVPIFDCTLEQVEAVRKAGMAVVDSWGETDKRLEAYWAEYTLESTSQST